MKPNNKYVAEFLGTFMLVFIGAGAICADYYLTNSGGQGIGILGISAAFGLVVIAAVYAISYISGAHINPAVTISFWVGKRMEANTAIFYIISQLLGLDNHVIWWFGPIIGGIVAGVVYDKLLSEKATKKRRK
jgi:glycerol uptake facilitator protein